MYIGLNAKYLLFLSLLMKVEFSWQAFEKYSNFMTIRPVGAELLHADGQKDMKTLIVTLRNFANAPEML